MDTLTRRRFLLASGVTGAAALAAGAGTVGWREIAGRAEADPLPTDANVLVLVTLYGGNDGLGTVVPYADGAYHDARPDLAYGEDEVLALDDQLGLNPAMKGFKSLWDAKRLAIVRGVGYPKPDHSHFRSMDIWQSGSPDHPANTGWIGRWLDATRPDPLRVVSVGATLPPLAVGAKAAGVALPLTEFAAPTGADRRRGRGSSPRPTRPTRRARRWRPGPPARCCPRPRRSARRWTPRAGRPMTRTTEDRALGRRAERAGPRSSRSSSRCVKAGVPTQVYAVSLGGFDTHADEKGTQSRLLGELDSAVTGVPRRHGQGSARGPRWSSRSTPSSAGGSPRTPARAPTTAPPARCWSPATRSAAGSTATSRSLTSLDAGDLKVTTDFRSVYGTLLEQVLDTEAGRVLDGTRPTLDFL